MAIPAYAERLRRSREKIGLSERDVAQTARIKVSRYCDLESSSDLTNNCSLEDIVRICGVIGIRADSLFKEEYDVTITRPIPATELVANIRDYCRKKGISPSVFDDTVGWAVSANLGKAKSITKEWNIDCLRSVCNVIGADWFGALAGLELEEEHSS